MNAIYVIPERNLAWLKAELARLSKKAQKVGSSPIVLRVISHEDRCLNPTVPEAERRYRRYCTIELSGEVPKFAGWSFLATIEHTPDGNIVRKVPGTEELSPALRTCEPTCDHCRLTRSRSETFVLRHDDQTTKRVGRNCLRDFLGHADPHQLADWATCLMLAGDLCNSCEDDDFDGVGRQSTRFGLRTFLKYVALSVFQEGKYISGKEVREMAYSTSTKLTTAQLASGMMFPPLGHVSPAMTPEAVDLAEKSIAWARGFDGIPNLNDFQHNLLVIARGETIEHRHTGLAAYIVEGYRRDLERQLSEAQVANSNFVGELRSRVELDQVTLIYTTSFNSPTWGTQYIYKFIDQGGNVLIYKTASDRLSTISIDTRAPDGKYAPVVGSIFKVRGTVKKHDVYREVKQTTLTRCKFQLI